MEHRTSPAPRGARLLICWLSLAAARKNPPPPPPPYVCTDTAGWTNRHGKTCDDYATAFCNGTAVSKAWSWVSGEAFGHPERHCCMCGKEKHRFDGISVPSPPAGPHTDDGYEIHENAYCRGADREKKTASAGDCQRHCASRKCACVHFGKGVCRFGYTYLGLLRSGEGFAAYVRPGAAGDPAALRAAEREAAKSDSPKCGVSTPPRPTPSFYMYDGPEFSWGERLAACYERRNGRPPWAMPRNASISEVGPAPHADLSHGLWLHSALLNHRRRLREPRGAALYIVPAYGSLSEATGTCQGTTHLQRMAAVAEALKASPAFSSAPNRHVVYAAGTVGDVRPLGALGDLLASSGSAAICTVRSSCSLKFKKRAEVPMLPLLSLMQPHVQSHLALEACGSRPGARRKTTLFFRGAHSVDVRAQAVRARAWALRSLPKVDVKFSRGGPQGLDKSTKDFLTQHGYKGVRMPYSPGNYVNGMLHSDFCLLPRGDATNPGRRMVDAVAAGCVPVLVGDTLRPVLSKSLRYDAFTIRVDEAEFLRYPESTMAAALEAAAPRLPELRRALVEARNDLLLGYSSSPLELTSWLRTRGADLVLIEVGRAICPRTPASLTQCAPAAESTGATAATIARPLLSLLGAGPAAGMIANLSWPG